MPNAIDTDPPSGSDQSAYQPEEQNRAMALFTDHYAALEQIARQKRRRSGAGDSLQTADVLHEAYLRLANSNGFNDLTHFWASAALAIRHVIVDHARKRLALKRRSEGDIPVDDADHLLTAYSETPEQIVTISSLIDLMAKENPRWTRILDARYFAGLTEEETAKVMSLSVRTVRRDWQDVRQWLAAHLRSQAK